MSQSGVFWAAKMTQARRTYRGGCNNIVVLTLICRLRRDHNLPFNSSSASYQMGILGHQFTNAVSETADRWLDETFYSGPPSLDSHTSFAAGADVPSFLPPSFITRSEDARGLSLDSALDSTSTNVEATSQGDNSLDAGKTIELIWEREDPVSLKLLNRPAAQYLYDGLVFYKEQQ